MHLYYCFVQHYKQTKIQLFTFFQQLQKACEIYLNKHITFICTFSLNIIQNKETDMNKPAIKPIIIFAAVALAICSAAALFLCLRSSGCAPYGPPQEISSDTDVVSPTDGYASGTDAVSDSDTADDAVITFPAVDMTTTASTTTSTAASTAETSTTKGSTTTAKNSSSATAATTAVQTLKNAQYVVDPDYKSPYYIVVFAGDSQSVAIYGKDADGAYNVLTKCFTCSTGAKASPTRTGQYKVWRRFRWRLLVGNVYGQYSTSISSDYLFHSVPYLKQKASALDMAEYDKLGTPASHGCIRLCVRDSKWIYENCPNGTQVNIVNVSGPKGAGYPLRNTNSIYNGWDPSDPDPSNPYIKTPPTTTTTAVSKTTTAKSTTTTSSTSAATVSSSAATTTVTTTTAATTASTAPSRWVNQAEIDRIISSTADYAESIGMSCDSSLSTANAYWSPDTKVYTDSFASAADCEARLKSVVSYIYNGNFGYGSVNITAVMQSSGEYIITCCFA